MRRPLATPQDLVKHLLDGYRQGAFPMADLPSTPRILAQAARSAIDPAQPLPVARQIRWYSPDPRAIIPIETLVQPIAASGEKQMACGLHIPGGLRRHVRSTRLVFTCDVCFERVIRACAVPRLSPKSDDDGEPDTHAAGLWLDETLVQAYVLLHQYGHAHSIEAWRVDAGGDGAAERDAAAHSTLVGGIYGLSIGAAFFAESMFCRPELGGTNASNLCLVQLYAHLKSRGYALLDVQIANEHTARFGVVEIPRADYLKRLASALEQSAEWGMLEPSKAAGLLAGEVKR